MLISQYYQHLIINAREHWKAGNENLKLALLKISKGEYVWIMFQRVVCEISDLAEDSRDLIENANEEKEWKFLFYNLF
jgi:hypothetical protein